MEHARRLDRRTVYERLRPLRARLAVPVPSADALGLTVLALLALWLLAHPVLAGLVVGVLGTLATLVVGPWLAVRVGAAVARR